MAGVKISNLPAATTPLSGTESVPVVQSGVTARVTAAALGAAASYATFGAGAVATTVQTKLRETVSVKDFGAVGDGVTNDTTAFNNAIATGKKVYVPKGTYKINLVITTSAVAIVGDGTGATILSPYVAANPVITINGDLAGTIIQYFSFADFSIAGNAKAGDGIKILNTADTRGCDRISMVNVDTSQCAYGLNCSGRSIWNYFENCAWDFNIDGVHIETNQAVNAWMLNSCFTRRNNRHGFYGYKTDVNVSGMIGLGFYNFNSEYNGSDISQAVAYGVYLNGAQGVSFYDLLLENNGDSLTSQEGYGLYVTGSLGRGVVVDGCWAVNSKHPIKIDGQKKSGSINNVHTLAPLYGGAGIEIAATWSNDEPKIELGPIISGTITVTIDANGNSPTLNGVDWVAASPTTVNFANRKAITYATQTGAGTISTANGLLAGDEINIFNFAGGTANTVTLAAGLMNSGVAYAIPANTAKKFLVIGFPNAGKLVPL